MRQMSGNTHRTFCDTLLPLAHPGALLQGGAFLQQQIPATVWVSGPHARSGAGEQKLPFNGSVIVQTTDAGSWQNKKSKLCLNHNEARESCTIRGCNGWEKVQKRYDENWCLRKEKGVKKLKLIS